MKIIRRYTAIQLHTEQINYDINVNLYYGEVTGPYYNLQYPKKEFDTEEEAVEYAYKTNKYARWLIIPIVDFDTSDEPFIFNA